MTGFTWFLSHAAWSMVPAAKIFLTKINYNCILVLETRILVCYWLQIINSNSFLQVAFPWHHAWRKKSLNCFNLFGVGVIAALANAARWIFKLWKINCKICSSNFCTISTTKDTTIMTHVFKKGFVVFFTWWVLPRSHNNWYRIF